jgi:transposase
MSTDAADLPDESTLPDDPETLKGMIRELLAMLHDREQPAQELVEPVLHAVELLYGPKGEHFRPDQPVLFDGGAEPASPTPNAPVPAEAGPVVRIRSGHGRRKLPTNLPRERVVHDVAEAEKTCPCCASPRTKIGEETSEQLDYRPAKLFVVEHVRLKYACPKCLKTGSESPSDASDTPSSLIVTAAKPIQPVDKGLPGPDCLPTSSCRSTATICRCIARRPCSRDRASNCRVPRSPTGWPLPRTC